MLHTSPRFRLHISGLAAALLCLPAAAWAAQTKLADAPITATKGRLANIAIAASVEYPTAISGAHKDATFNPNKTPPYTGYFDPAKCYTWSATNGYFSPVAMATGTPKVCNKQWSGNFLNYVTMQTIDIFRWAMTGGSRLKDEPKDSSVSTPSLVVLRRTYNSGQGGATNFPDRTLSSADISKYVNPGDIGSPNANLTFNSRGKGGGFDVTYTSGGKNRSYSFTAAVEVCNASVGLETNCVAYRDSAGNVIAYKPEGLMQKYKSDFRFSVFGYSQISNIGQYGGIMRAPMKFLENSLGTSELTDTGAFVTNPDSALATASGVTNSGAINYLNNFGFEGLTYKTYDPVSELYAEVIRYFQGEATPSAAALGATTQAQLDYHPLVSNWSAYPPIKYTCDKNYVVGIGDVNTHHDTDMAASMNASSWTAAIGTAEGMSNLATKRNLNGDGTGYDYSTGGTLNPPDSCCSGNNSNYIAGLAYYANTNDVNSSLTGTQTVQTYWVDVLEYQVYKHRNQYWLAAKYGGFKDSTSAKDVSNKNGDLPNMDAEWWTNCRTVSNTIGNCSTTPASSSATFPIPDNYFPAADADGIVTGLGSTFAKIKSETASGTGVSAATNIFPSGSTTNIYQTSYDSEIWAGDVIQRQTAGTFDSLGNLNATTIWKASSVLENQFAGAGWNTGRRVFTMGLTTGVTPTPTPKPFRIPDLTATQLATLGSTASDQQEVLEYLRGDRSKEGTKYRPRRNTTVANSPWQPLGDIVNSAVTVVAPPNAKYTDDFNPGYGKFKSDNSARAERLYFGANDGMLHALDASTGQEVFAYIPSVLFEGETLEMAGVAEIDGLATLANKTYSHRYFVNATPVARDVDFARAGDENWKTTNANPDWRTILVGGLGKGGKMFYAIDITTPVTTSDAEATAAGKLLWEFTDPELGYSFGEPLVIKTERWGWVVVFSGGYNNSTGKAVIFIVHPQTGALIQKVYATASTATAGTATNPAGLTEVTGFTASYASWIYNELYAADLFGNVWRFDLPPNKAVSGSSSTVTVTHFATLTDGTNPQSVTTPPWVDLARDGKRYLFVGTGRGLDLSDVTGSTGTNVQTQTFYAFRDGDIKAPFGTATGQTPLPSSKTFPLTRTDLDQVSNLINGRTGSTGVGWYYNQPRRDPKDSSNPATERIVKNIKGNSGVIAWLGDVPSNDPCAPGYTSAVYGVEMGTGISVLKDTSGNAAAYLGGTSNITSMNFARIGQGISILTTDTTGATKELTKLGGGTTPRIVNWRTIGE